MDQTRLPAHDPVPCTIWQNGDIPLANLRLIWNLNGTMHGVKIHHAVGKTRLRMCGGCSPSDMQ
eukprot:scaffold525112_cov41-Prasinocladus_malaysianus.AAC.1